MLVTTSFGAVAARQQLQQLEPLAENLVLSGPVERFGSRKSRRRHTGEERQIVDQFVDLDNLRTDDKQRGRGVDGQRGRHQRAGRSPDSVQSRRVALSQTVDDLGEARLTLQASDQL